MNPYFTGREQIRDAIDKDLAPFFYPDKVEELYFYGAGVGLATNRDKIADILSDHFENARIDVMTDMLGAARALFGKGSGVACILGTGSNCCVYKNGQIQYQPPSLGYILGDEGGGVDLGKQLLRAYIRKLLPEDLQLQFFQKYKKDDSTLLESIYRMPGPNAFIAGFTPFLKENIENPFIRSMVKGSFHAFIDGNVIPGNLDSGMTYGFTGSVANAFRDILLEVMDEKGILAGPVLASPIEGLVSYHGGE